MIRRKADGFGTFAQPPLSVLERTACSPRLMDLSDAGTPHSLRLAVSSSESLK